MNIEKISPRDAVSPSRFEKNQVLVHSHHGECVALFPWNDRETVCLVTATRRRLALMNCFLQPVLGSGPRDHCICVVDDSTVKELEGNA
jgi:hypothetical protein